MSIASVWFTVVSHGGVAALLPIWFGIVLFWLIASICTKKVDEDGNKVSAYSYFNALFYWIEREREDHNIILIGNTWSSLSMPFIYMMLAVATFSTAVSLFLNLTFFSWEFFAFSMPLFALTHIVVWLPIYAQSKLRKLEETHDVKMKCVFSSAWRSTDIVGIEFISTPKEK